MVKCCNCKWFDWDWVFLNHGGEAKLGYCEHDEYKVVDFEVERTCLNFEEKDR